MYSFFKQIVCIALASVFLLQTFSTTIVLADYQLNKDYIAKVLCINKSKPKMHCNGKCHLKKELSKAEKKEKSPVNPTNEKSKFQLFSEKLISVDLFSTIAFVINTSLSDYCFPLSDKHLDSIFHPPQA